MREITTAKGNEEFVVVGAWVMTTAGEIGQVTKIMKFCLKVNFTEEHVKRIADDEITAVGESKEELAALKEDLPKAENLEVVPPTKAITVRTKTKWEVMKELHQVVLGDKVFFEEEPNTIEEVVVDAIEALYAFMANRDSIDGNNPIDAALKLVVTASTYVGTGKDNR